ncbi:MAG: transketolase family protein [Chloroflexi bacterium]|nr:MAG: transketolase family protein [Chloroflexota bacterium]
MSATGDWKPGDSRTIRDGFGQAIVELAERDERIVALTADLSEALRVHQFAERYPSRFFQMGIAEQDMIGVAAGLALSGFVPFATTFAIFATSRANEQVRLAVAYNRANVKIVGALAGLHAGEDGATHQALEDIAAMRALPGMTIVSPADARQAARATEAAAAMDGPVYLRLARTPTRIVTDESSPFELGKANVLREGRDVTLVATGPAVPLALDAADRLEESGVGARVIDMHTIKPLDEARLVEAARFTGAFVTVEDHSVIGGLGGAVCEALARTAPAPIEVVGVADTFGESGRPDELWRKYGLTVEAVVGKSPFA